MTPNKRKPERLTYQNNLEEFTPAESEMFFDPHQFWLQRQDMFDFPEPKTFSIIRKRPGRKVGACPS